MAAALLQWRAHAWRNPNFCPGWRGGGGGVWPSCTGGVLLHRFTLLQRQRATVCHRKEKNQSWGRQLQICWKSSWSRSRKATHAAGAFCGSSSSNNWEKWRDTSNNSSRVRNKSIIGTGGPGFRFLLLPWRTSSSTIWRRGAATGVATVEQQPQQQHHVADKAFRAPPPLAAEDNSKDSEQEMRALLSTGDLDRALDILLQQQQPGAKLFSNAAAYSALLSGCSKRKALGTATRLSAHMSAAGLLDSTSSPALGEQLVSTLVQCGGLEAALHVFHRLPATTAFSWTAVISGYAAAGAPRAALRLYRRLLDQATAAAGNGAATALRPNSYTFVSALKACGALGDLVAGRAVHTDAARAGVLAADPFVGAALVDMYAKCGGADAARSALEELPRPAVSVVAWNAVLAACVREGRPLDAVEAYGRMRTGGGGVSPSDRTLVSAAQACGMLAEAESEQQQREHWAGVGRGVHTDARRRGWDTRDVFVGCTLISMYGKCGALRDAEAVFAGLTTAGAGQRRQVDAVAWNAMLAAYVHLGRADAALALYRDGVASGALASPDDRTFACVVQACAALAEADPGRREWVLEQGAAVHAACRRKGGLDARSVFVGNALITMYARCGSLAAAEAAFAGLEPRRRDVVSWSAVMAACAGLGRPARTLELYDQMLGERAGGSGGGASPNARTLVSAIQACGALAEEVVDGDDDGGTTAAAGALERGRRVHADARRRGWDSRDVFVGNALVSMYGKCGAVGDAAAVFRGMLARDLVSWNAMLAAHADAGDAVACLRLYDQVVTIGLPTIAPDARTFAVAAQACGVLADSSSDDSTTTTTMTAALARTRSVHTAAEAAGLAESLYVGTALVTAYAKCGALPAAESVFSTTLAAAAAAATTGDAALWNAMLSGYLHLSRPDLALTLHQSHPHHPADAVTHLCVLTAAGATGTLSACRRAHAALLRLHRPPGHDAFPSALATALVHAYGRCGSMPDAQAAFDALPPGRRHPATATALVAGYARAGGAVAAWTTYRAMPRPDGVALAAVLAACAHTGMVAEGVQAFTEACGSAREGEGEGGGGVVVEPRHMAGLVDLVARAGHLSLARQLAETAVAGDPGGGRGEEWASVWLSVLGACRTRCGGGGEGKEQEEVVATARWAFARAVAAGPWESAAYVLMAGVCVEAGRWEEAREVRRMRRAAGAVKAQGRSWVDVEEAGNVEGVVGFASGEGVPVEVGAVLGQLRALVGDDKLLITGGSHLVVSTPNDNEMEG